MVNISELKKQLHNFYVKKQYDKANEIFEIIWNDENIIKNKWDYYRYAFCLKKLKKWQDLSKITLEGINKFPDSKILKNFYGWSIYYLNIKDCDNQKKLERFVNEVIKFTEFDDPFSPYVLSVFKILDFYNNKDQVKYTKILYWCEKLNAEILDEKTFKLEDGKELPSKKEKYFMYLSNALFHLRRYEDCISACNKALEIKNLHYNNNIWFKRRKALCFFHIKQYEESLKLMLEIKSQIAEWFILLELSEIYYAIGDSERSYKYLLKATLSKGDIDKKIHVYDKLGEILLKMKRDEDAKKHFVLSEKIRLNNGWKSSSDIKSEELLKINEKTLLKELKSFWESEYGKLTMKIKGTIINLFPDGRSGFVKLYNGHKYYFKNKSNKPIKLNDKVDFIIDESFDPKKKKISDIAILC